MSIKRIKTILFKDLKDVIRDSRILVAIITPLLIGVVYNYTFQDDTTPSATIAYTGGPSELPTQLQQAVGSAANVHLQAEPNADAVQATVVDKDGDSASEAYAVRDSDRRSDRSRSTRYCR